MTVGATYGKPVDIFAVGIIMYELLSGRHPLYERGEDRMTYSEKLKKFNKLKFDPKYFSKYFLF